ncbi:SMI1/KNR4 family protein [Litoribacillus peritrichatus]|uniref:Knr4/Smi1-like domain-containing protein n=1 Tax=Litoribacillus peritrichatus TaxID=718191 RepID=A0ABP7N2R9_9GAMM
MNLEESITLIKSFITTDFKLAEGIDIAERQALENEKGISFPPELKAYIETVCPNLNLAIESVGPPVELLSRDKMSWTLPGYNFNPETNEKIENWDDDWFLIGHEGADPIIVSLKDQGPNSPVYSAIHGTGVWEFCPIADSIGEFLACAFAVEHALNFPGIDQPMDDDFNLLEIPAQWLFPFIKKYAEPYYDEWVGVFENYLDEY